MFQLCLKTLDISSNGDNGLKLKDRDFIETVEGFFFCIVGYLHPPDKYTAYLKYIPSKTGKWGTSVRYERALEYYHAVKVYKTIRFLEKKYPHYIHYCPVRHIKISMVPREAIKKYYSAKERLKEILKESRDPLEREVCELVHFLSEISGLKTRDFGVTGSILIKIHNPNFSDIDLTVYGARESFKLREAMENLSENSLVKKPGRDRLEEWIKALFDRFKIPPKEARIIAQRRWNYGFFRERYFSVHPIRKDYEITEKYGDKYYFPIKTVEGICTISDASESFFLPAIYKVENVRGINVEIEEIVSYEGIFSGIAFEGEDVKFKGKLERVEPRRGEPYYRVVIGTAEVPDNYLVPVISGDES